MTTISRVSCSQLGDHSRNHENFTPQFPAIQWNPHFLNIVRSEINISFDSFLFAMCENYVWSESVNYLYSDYKIFFTFWTTKIWIYAVWWPRVSLLSLRFRHFPVPKLFYGSKREIPKSVPGCEIQSIGRAKARPRQVMSSIEIYVAIKLSVTRTSFRPVLAF